MQALVGNEALLPLAPGARWLFHAQAFARFGLVWVPVTVTGAMMGTAFVGATEALVASGALLLLTLLLAVWWPSLSFDRYGYALRSSELLIQHGVLIRTLTAIPLGRVQHVDVRQGLLEQWFGLARVHVHTASGLASDGVIPGLALPDAERLRDELVAHGNRGDDGV